MNDWSISGGGLTGDVDGDEHVDLYDLSILAKYWLDNCVQ